MKLKEIPISFFNSVRLRHLKSLRKKRVEKRLPIIVSLTSIPSRLSTLDIVIASILSQDSPPQLIILWLNYSLKGKLPKRLLHLQSDLFIINYCEGTTSYRKLLPSLKAYPNSTIVTCDDDMIYPSNWLSNLYNSHLAQKQCVISQVGRLIERDDNGELKPYKNWSFIRSEKSQLNFLPIGYGGVLYPANTFNEQVFDESLFLKLSPKADDLWFKAMAYLNGKRAYCASEKARPIPIIRSQKVALNSANIGEDKNRQQWQALCEYYPSLKAMTS